MPVQFPVPEWPAELTADGPPEDPLILLSGSARIGQARHQILAVRVNANTLAVDFRADLDEGIYADHQLEDMFDELTSLNDIDKTALVPVGRGHYVIWMMPCSDTG